MNLAPYTEKWQLSAVARIATTPTSEVYRARRENSDVVLKVFTHANLTREARAADALEYFGGHGCVRLLAKAEGAHLLEFVSGQQLKALSAGGNDEEAAQVICDVVAKLHARPANHEAPKLISMRENFRVLFDDRILRNADLIYLEGRKVAAMLLETERDIRVLHGDLHHQNIIESSGRGWIAIDPYGIVGERTNDLANIFFNPDDQTSLTESEVRIGNLADTFSERLQLDRRRILEFAFAHGCLSSAWCLEHGKDPSRRLRITRLIQKALQ